MNLQATVETIGTIFAGRLYRILACNAMEALSPIDQFELMGFYVDLGFLKITLTIGIVYTFVGVLLNIWILYGGFLTSVSGKYVTGWKYLGYTFYRVVYELVRDGLGSFGRRYLSLLYGIFTFLICLNVQGMVPFAFTVTSHLSVTLGLALAMFIGIVIICFLQHGVNFFGFFVPAGTPVGLTLLLVLIEVFSYLFRPISLGIRLFANMMAGHALVKIVAGFVWIAMILDVETSLGYLKLIASVIPFVMLCMLIGLEIAVAFIQAYVFMVLLILYLNDAIEGH